MKEMAAPGGTEVIERDITLTVNGSARRIPAGSTLTDLLDSLDLDARAIVVEHNGTILRDRSSFASHGLSENDSLEIVHFVGGG